MPFAPVFSVVAPLAGLFVLLVVARFPRLRFYRRFVAPAGAVLSLIGVLAVPMEPAQVAILSYWRPSVFFGASPALLAAPEVWCLALAFSCAVTASLLVQLSRVPEPRFPLGISALGMLAAGLAGLWGENLLTVLIAWAGFDLAWGLGMAAAGLPARQLVLGAGLNGLATMALWVGALASGGGGLSWQFMPPAGLGGGLLLVAGLLRLSLYPLHLTLPEEDGQGQPGAAPLLLGPVLGWGMLARLAAVGGGTLVVGPWLEGLAAVTFVGGGFLAWTRTGPGGGWPWASLAGVGEVLWASLLAGEAALPVLVAGGAAWALGTTLLRLDKGLDLTAPWWSATGALGGMALLGAPLTLGLVPAAFLAGSFATPFAAGKVVVFLIGQGLLTAAVARRVLRTAPAEEPAGPLPAAARAAGLILPTALLLLGGAWPDLLVPFAGTLWGLLAQSGVIGWGSWAAGIVVGAVLSWQERRFRQRLEPLLGLVHDIFRLEWVLRLVLNSLARASAFLSVVAEVVEGPGAILWALAIFLLVLLIVVGR
ncbi:MAG TPA: hypothetical protein ENI37_07075 [Chloroflexi bacterium]|nr:hypothetical protein [Chloroflexota bacterium]